MSISKINVGGTSHDLKDGLLHTVNDKPNYLLNNLLSAPDTSAEPLTRFTAEQMQNILNKNYTKALPVGARIQLPAVSFTDGGVTYNESAKEWVYCGNADAWGSMIFMMADETIYNIESDLAKAKYNCEDVGPTDTSIFSSTVLSVLTSSAVGLSKVIKKQFENFVSEHSGVYTYIAPQECWYPLAKAQLRAIYTGNNVTFQQQAQQAWTTMEAQASYADLGEENEILFDCATSFNIFGTIAFPNLLLNVVLANSSQATKINYREADIYAYGGRNPLRKFQFPIFQGQQAGEVFQQNFPSSVILDERRYAPRKSGNYFPFGMEYPTYIGGGLLGLTTQSDVNEKNLERMLPYVIVSFD